MSVKFYNTLSRELEEFKSIEPGKVGMYTCGPTVYNYAHIGNFRAYVFEDLLRRVLKYAGYDVTQIMNLTDVDDKTIRDSQAAGKSLNDFTAIYKEAFFDDLNILRVEPAEEYPAATDNIPEMIELIQILIDKGYGYIGDDGSVYYSIEKFECYGCLGRINLEGQRSGVRISTDEYEKDQAADFALWKKWEEADGDVWWESPWGKGRPGWHIECSAMSMKYLGNHFDMHTGGVDNMFPHHDDEIAQSEAATGEKYVNYWLHCEHLMVNNGKMSKSKGNFFTLRQLIEKGYTGREVRWLLLNTHYRQKLNFLHAPGEQLEFPGLEEARTALKRLDVFTSRINDLANGSKATDWGGLDVVLDKAAARFKAALIEDLNISGAQAALFDLVREINRAIDEQGLSQKDADIVLSLLRKFDNVLSVLDVDDQQEDEVPVDIQLLADKRQQARKDKNWSEADRLRDELKQAGWQIVDTPDGAKVVPL